jgi:hypothetical protein
MLSGSEISKIILQADKMLEMKQYSLANAVAPVESVRANEFYSEGDYWWPDPENTSGAYIRRDGESYPGCFNRHRKMLIRMSVQVASLTQAFLITGRKQYAAKAEAILKEWFLDSGGMQPHLRFAQAIKGRCEGRSIGIIDTVHLAETALTVGLLEASGGLSNETSSGLKEWFTDYLEWLLYSTFGQEERNYYNNHGTCWYLQAAAFARLTGNAEVLELCRKDFKLKLILQMDESGGFPAELERTKPYSYSIFNLEVMCALAQVISDENVNLFEFSTADGRGLALAMEFLYPYLKNKELWPYEPDIVYWSCWPNRQASLLFCGRALNEPKYIDLWHDMQSDLRCFEVIRNFPVKVPWLWVAE